MHFTTNLCKHSSHWLLHQKFKSNSPSKIIFHQRSVECSRFGGRIDKKYLWNILNSTQNLKQLVSLPLVYLRFFVRSDKIEN